MPALGAPNWDAITRDDVRCPLCEYNLRGLVDARCPECGHQFDWPVVLDPTNCVHPYVFEHHPERNVRSFVRTVAATLNPVGFWRTLRPTHSPRPRRLLVYWVVTAALASLALVADWARATRDMWGFRTAAGGWVFYTPYSVTPAPTVEGFWTQLWGTAKLAWRADFRFEATIALWVVWLVWPSVTLATLMIFRASMRRAKIKTAHVLRCLAYTFDVGAWFGLAATVSAVGWFALAPPPDPDQFAMPGWRNCLPFAILGVVVVRLWLAYRCYLRFAHAFWTVVASQVITILFLAAAASVWHDYLRGHL